MHIMTRKLQNQLSYSGYVLNYQLNVSAKKTLLISIPHHFEKHCMCNYKTALCTTVLMHKVLFLYECVIIIE
jgi:hypothetical protein